MRENGFQKPYNTMQILTWILLPTLVIQFLLFVSPVLPVAASVPCTVLFVALGSTSAYQAYKCCATNPVDAKLVRHLERQKGEGGGNDGAEGGGDGDDDDTDSDDHTKYCWVCQTDVEKKSMHCKFCDKCVSNFDHHCMWLNTCVGSANYGYFYNTVVVTFCFVLVHCACLAGVAISYFVQAYGSTGGTGGQVDRMNGWFGANVPLVPAIVDLLFLIVNLASLSLIGQLFVFHIGLRKEGITTYEYIVRENGRKRDKSKADMEVRSKRLVLLRAAKNKGQRGEICSLQLGRVCVPCDPARKAVEEDKRRDGEEKERRDRAKAADEEEGGFSHEEDDEGDGSSDAESGGGGGGVSTPIQPSGPVQATPSDDDNDGTGGRISPNPQPPETEGVAPEQPRPTTSALQEAMAASSRTYHNNHDGNNSNKSSSGGDGTPPAPAPEPEFISVGVTECTHPSLNSITGPSDNADGGAHTK